MLTSRKSRNATNGIAAATAGNKGPTGRHNGLRSNAPIQFTDLSLTCRSKKGVNVGRPANVIDTYILIQCQHCKWTQYEAGTISAGTVCQKCSWRYCEDKENRRLWPLEPQCLSRGVPQVGTLTPTGKLRFCKEDSAREDVNNYYPGADVEYYRWDGAERIREHMDILKHGSETERKAAAEWLLGDGLRQACSDAGIDIETVKRLMLDAIKNTK